MNDDRNSAPKADALPGCATPRLAKSLRSGAVSAQAPTAFRGNERQNEAGTGETSPEIFPEPRISCDYVSKGARISACGSYRYLLWREWRLHPLPAQWDMWSDDDGSPVLDGAGQQLGAPLSCVFVMLNPSTADGEDDDPTIRRCVSFAKRFGFDRLEVVNLFAFRATNPKDMLASTSWLDPVGHENQRYVEMAVENAGLIICAWGAHGGHVGQDETMLGWIEQANYRDAPIVALGVTKGGFPRHPLYLKADAAASPYNGRTPPRVVRG